MIENAIRTLFWSGAKLLLAIGDWIYEIFETILSIDLSESNVIFYSWAFMLLFLTSACFIRVAFIFIQKNSSDSEGFDGFKIIKRIGGMFLVVALSTTCFTFSLGIPKTVTDIYNRVITYDERLTPSSAVISATAKTRITNSLDSMSETDEVISIETIDEKLNKEENGEKIYFVSYSELLLCAICAFVVTCVQLNIITDTILRLFLNIFRFIIGFIPISSMVEDNSTCREWVIDIISDTFVMCCNLIFTKVVFGIMATTSITSLNGIIRIVVLTVGLMAVSKTGEIIAKYMGASNLSSGGKVGSMLLGAGAMMSVRAAGKVLKGIAKYTGKGIGKGIDRVLPKDKKKNNSKNRDKNVNGSKISPNSGSGLGVNNNSKDLGKHFVNNGGSQNSFNSNSNNSTSDKNVLDRTPTENNKNIEGNTDNNRKGSSSINMSNTQNRSSDKIADTNNSISKNNINKNMENKENKNFNRGTNKGFVNTDTTGHLYKQSSSVYKVNARDIAKNNLKNNKTNNKVGGVNENNRYDRNSTNKL